VAEMLTHDYVSPTLTDPGLQFLFPNMVESDRDLNDWKYLRREIPHIWRADQRSPIMGFVSVDEAALLRGLALPFVGRRALEIGCWRGWSTAHIASAGVVLDVIDPVLNDPQIFEEMQTMLSGLGASGRVALYPEKSPGAIFSVAEEHAEPWSFAFIDGDHENDAPSVDAANIAVKMARDAMVVFHDLASPCVGNGLAYLRDKGWNTMIFQTMQIMGVAWRGDVAVPLHIPDPSVDWQIPEHLETYPVSGETVERRVERFQIAAFSNRGLALELAAARAALEKMFADHAAEQSLAQAWIVAERENAKNWAKIAADFQALYCSSVVGPISAQDESAPANGALSARQDEDRHGPEDLGNVESLPHKQRRNMAERVAERLVRIKSGVLSRW
jgi:predicted O-methyltransferase YrrM